MIIIICKIFTEWLFLKVSSHKAVKGTALSIFSKMENVSANLCFYPSTVSKRLQTTNGLYWASGQVLKHMVKHSGLSKQLGVWHLLDGAYAYLLFLLHVAKQTWLCCFFTQWISSWNVYKSNLGRSNYILNALVELTI